LANSSHGSWQLQVKIGGEKKGGETKTWLTICEGIRFELCFSYKLITYTGTCTYPNLHLNPSFSNPIKVKCFGCTPFLGELDIKIKVQFKLQKV